MSDGKQIFLKEIAYMEEGVSYILDEPMSVE